MEDLKCLRCNVALEDCNLTAGTNSTYQMAPFSYINPELEKTERTNSVQVLINGYPKYTYAKYCPKCHHVEIFFKMV